MHRFYVNKEDILDGKIIINNEDVKHIRNVLRLNKDDILVICDGENTDYKVKITNINKNEIITEILDIEKTKTESNLNISLYQGLPKSNKMDLIIQKATELGVKEIIPVLTSRTVVKINDKKKESKKIERWQKIATEASKQCRRGIVPKIKDVITFDEMILNIKNEDNIIVPYENEKNKTLKNTLQNIKGNKINIIIGPEGGFDIEEVDILSDINASIVTLGPRILRTETAGLTAIAITMYELGDLG